MKQFDIDNDDLVVISHVNDKSARMVIVSPNDSTCANLWLDREDLSFYRDDAAQYGDDIAFEVRETESDERLGIITFKYLPQTCTLIVDSCLNESEVSIIVKGQQNIDELYKIFHAFFNKIVVA